MKKVKEFTLRKSENCRGVLFDASGNRCCVTGAFFKACGAPIASMKDQGYNNEIGKEVAKLYSKELNSDEIMPTYVDGLESKLYNVLDEAMQVNDNKKTNWTRRLKKLREIFGRIGVRIRFRD